MGRAASGHHRLPSVAGDHERIFAQYADRCQVDLVVFPASRPIGPVPGQLSQLASLLERGLLTREEFDHLKAKLTSEA